MKTVLDNHQRDTSIDIAKGIGILLVVLQHCISTFAGGQECELSKFILSFHMPLFFALSGFLYKYKPLREFISGKAISLLLPTAIFRTINAIVYFALFMVGQIKIKYFVEFAGFWFLITLFYVTMLYYLFDSFCRVKAFKQKHIILLEIVFAIGAIVLGLIHSSSVVGTENTTATTLVGLFYYILGRNIKRLLDVINISPKKYLVGCLAVIFLILTYFASRFNTPVVMYQNKYGNVGLFLLSSISGTIATLSISMVIAKARILEYYGRNSLIILITQFSLYRTIMKILSLFGIPMLFGVIMGFVLIAVIEVPIIHITNKYLPFLLGKLSFLNQKDECR